MTTIIKIKYCCRIFCLALLLLSLNPLHSIAQADSTAPPDTSAPAAKEVIETPELLSPSLVFIAVQENDNAIELKATMRAKQKGQSYKLYRMKVAFYNVTAGGETALGYAITNGEGKAVFIFKADTLKADAEGKLQFKAVFAGNKAMEPAEETVTFKKAKLELTPVKEDSTLSIQIKLTETGADSATPIKDVVVGIYVKRLFLPLKVGEATTDENGEASVEFPAGLPGDIKGELTILAKIDENETYGYLETAVAEKWGVPVSSKSVEQPRALWSTHPPLWMLITFILLMVVVWGHYLVIVYELFRLRKEEPHTPATNA